MLVINGYSKRPLNKATKPFCLIISLLTQHACSEALIIALHILYCVSFISFLDSFKY